MHGWELPTNNNARAGGQKHLRLGEPFDVQEIPAVDHRRRQCAVINLRPRAWTPGGNGLGRIELCEMVAKGLKGVASFGEREPLRDQPLKFDRADSESSCLACERRCAVSSSSSSRSMRCALR